MRKYETPYEQKFYGGMYDTDDPESISRYEGVLVQNGNIRTVGAFIGRAGATLVGSDTGSQKILGWGVKRNGTKFMTRIVNGASVSQVEILSGATFTSVTGATLTKNRDVFTVECDNGAVYYFDGDGGHDVGKFDGSDWSTVAGIPKGRYTAYWKNFVFIAGVEAYPRRLYFSNIGAPETYGASNYIDFPEVITAVHAYFDRLVIGTMRTIYYIDGSGASEFIVSGSTTYVPTEFDFGIASHESVAIVGKELWAMNHEGRICKIFRTPYDVIFGEIVSGPIDSLISSLNKNALSKVTAASFNGYYIFYAPSGSATENNVGAYYDSLAKLPTDPVRPGGISRWQKHTGWYPSHFCLWESSIATELYWGESRADSKSYKWGGTSDNGTAIVMIWRSRQENNKYANRYKLYRYGKQISKAIGNYNGYVKANIEDRGQQTIKTINFSGNAPLWGTGVWGTFVWGAKNRLSDDFYFKDGGDDIAGKTLQMELYASYLAAIPEFYKQTYMYKLLKMR